MVTSIKQSPVLNVTFSCPVIDNFIWFEPHSKGYLPLNTGLTELINKATRGSPETTSFTWIFVYVCAKQVWGFWGKQFYSYSHQYQTNVFIEEKRSMAP